MNTIVDHREPALELSKENVEVHHIKRVAITTEAFPVSRSKWDQKMSREFEKRQKARFEEQKARFEQRQNEPHTAAEEPPGF